jgi:bifunctional non-homologous end joining protein LigD
MGPMHDGGPTPSPAANGDRFVVQFHRATRPHYDFRLELDGVLVSWAVPKGPSLDPKARRLAVHVEDHGLDHFDFEGALGRGDCIVWDWGTWSPAASTDPVAAIADGSIHFDLDGVKLGGRFVLTRSHRPAVKEEWLLLHKADTFADPAWDIDDHPRSVKSGLTNDELPRS